MADPTLPIDPWAQPPAPADPNAPPLNLGQYLPQVAPDQGLAPGLGIPNATLDAAAAAPGAPAPPPLGPDGQPLPLGASGQPALPDVGDQIGLAPDGVGLAPDGAPVQAIAPPALAPAPGAPLTPDAVSGGDISAQSVGGQLAGTEYGALNPLAARTESHGESFSGKPLEDPDQEEAIDLLKHMDPRDLAELNTRHETTRMLYMAGLQAKAEQRNLENIQADLAMRKVATETANAQTDDIVARAKIQAGLRVDPSHYMNSRSGGQVLLDLIGAVSGGFAAGAVPGGNGVNHYLDVMKDRINNDIDAQKANIANGWKGLEMEKSAVGENYVRTGDLYQAAETARLASWETVKGQIATQAQLYDPKGTLALAAANAWQAVNAQQQASAYKVNQDLVKNHIEAGKAGLEAQKFVADQEDKAAELAEKKREHDQTLGLEYTKLAEERAKRKDAKGKLYTASELGQLHPGQPTPPPTMTQGPDGQPVEVPYMTDKDYGEWLGNENKGQQNTESIQKNKAELAKGQVRNPLTGEPLTEDGTPNGKPLVVGGAEGAQKLNERTANTQNLLDSLSNARQAIEQGPSVFSRAKWAAIKTELGNGAFKFIEVNGAKPSSREMGAYKDEIGPDIDGALAKTTGKSKALATIDKMIDIAKREQATTLKTEAGFRGDPSKVLLDTSKPAAPLKSDVDALLERATDDLRKVDTTDANDVAYLRQEDPKGGIRLSSVEATEGKPVDSDIVKKSIKLKIAPSQLKAIDELHDRAVAGDRKAIDALGQIMDDGNTHAMKIYAAGMMRRIEQWNLDQSPVPPERPRP